MSDDRADFELLRCYTEQNSEEAFAELVRRHVHLVYQAALRQTGGDRSLAEDVTQSVFGDLARKAGSLARRPVIVGWLYTSTRFAATKASRTERRRQAREQAAHVMQELTFDSEPVADWERLRPVIDDVLHELDDGDRDAVLLRFFEGKTFPEVAAQLAMKEDAARARVGRALDKLHASLGRRGVTSTTAALAVALAGQASMAAPAGVVAGVILAGAKSAGGAASFLTFMSMTKIGVAVAAVAVGGAGFWWLYQTNAQLRGEVSDLRTQLQELSALRAERARNEGAKKAPEALPPPRPEIPPAKHSPAEGTPREVAKAPPLTLAAGLKPADAFVRGDRSTAKSAIESFYAAMNEGNVDSMASFIVLLPEDKKKAEALLAQLPEGKRAEVGSVEKLAVTKGAGSSPQVAGMQVMWEEAGARRSFMDPSLAKDPDYRTLHVQRQYADGRVREEDMVFQKFPDGWRWVMH